MQLPFRYHHILRVLEEYEKQAKPLDFFLSSYFRSNKALGSKDRGFIAETVYALVRWRGLLDFCCSQPLNWEKRLNFFESSQFEQAKNSQEIPLHVRLSFPKYLFDQLVDSYGIDKASEICAVSNTSAPTTVRVNALKTTRQEMLMRWRGKYEILPCKNSPEGIIFKQRINFFEVPEFKQGLFEIQDEGSQLIAQLVRVSPGESVMDYCAGAGGKTLAFAPGMYNKGQVYLHDVRKYALDDARKRLRRAGIQNAQVIQENEEAKLKKLKKSMDWVLVDAPCTGTGTMRRNPDMKWKFNEAMLVRLLGQQRLIFERALSFMKPSGKIIYATCSLLKQENQQQVEHFLKTYHLEIFEGPFISLPAIGEMDGFYGITLKQRG